MVAIAVLYLATSFLVGLLLVQRLFSDTPPLVRLAGGYLLGTLLTAWATFLVALILFPLDEALLIGILVVVAAQAMALGRWRRRLSLSSLKPSPGEAVLAVIAVAFSFWLMDQRLSGDPLMVSLNTWGDFGLHVPLARLFSWGHNLPPEYPFFAGEPIRYHFGFDFFAGALERQALPLDLAFNIPAALAMTAMIVLSFELGRLLFRKIAAGVIAAVLLMTNSSLAFIRYFEQFDNDVIEGLRNLWSHNRYLAIGPYDGQDIAIYWTLNVFLTRSHVIFGVALGLLVAYALIRWLRLRRPLGPYSALVLGAMLGLSFWINAQVYIAVLVFSVALFVVFLRWREAIPFLGAAGFIALPQFLYLGGGIEAGGNAQFHLGYLVEPLTFDHFFTYWWLNLGLALPLLVLAAVLARKNDKRLLLAIMAIFLFGNLVQLGRDLGGHTHVVFTVWAVLINLFVAFALLRVWQLKFVGWAVAPVLLLFLILSGIIDIMVIKNDPHFFVFDGKGPTMEWIADNTEEDAVFLTNPQNLYLEPTLAGRRLYLGFVQFTEGAGYDVRERLAIVNAIYNAPSKGEACRLLMAEEIDYVQVGPVERNSNPSINWQLFAAEFEAAFSAETPQGPLTLYDVDNSCQGI